MLHYHANIIKYTVFLKTIDKYKKGLYNCLDK